VIFLNIILQYIDKCRFCAKILCLSGLKSQSAESEFPRNRRDDSGHNKVGKKSNQKRFCFKNFDLTMNCVINSEKHWFFVVCEVILIENVRSAKSGPQNPQV
jgi:hypothetical protein